MLYEVYPQFVIKIYLLEPFFFKVKIGHRYQKTPFLS